MLSTSPPALRQASPDIVSNHPALPIPSPSVKEVEREGNNLISTSTPKSFEVKSYASVLNAQAVDNKIYWLIFILCLGLLAILIIGRKFLKEVKYKHEK